MLWIRILLLLFVFNWEALGQTIISIKFEPSFLCSREFLVAGQDYTVIEYLVSGSNSTFPLNHGFRGPMFYFTSTTSNNAISPCNGFDVVNNACTNRNGQPNACSCVEVTSGSVYLLSYNMTADPIFSEQSVFLVWPGPPALTSEMHSLPEVKDSCPDLSANKEDSLNVSSIVIGVIAAVLITGLIVVIIFLTMKIRRLKLRLFSLTKATVGQLDEFYSLSAPYSYPIQPIASGYSLGAYEDIQETSSVYTIPNSLIVYGNEEPDNLTSADIGSCGPYNNADI